MDIDGRNQLLSAYTAQIDLRRVSAELQMVQLKLASTKVSIAELDAAGALIRQVMYMIDEAIDIANAK